MPKNLIIYVSRVYEASFNLAFEQFIFENCKEDEVILYLWQNDKTIVVGRHQNPYKECSIDKLKADKVDLVRRASGGGAVYHDLGNLNFTFISQENNYDISKNYGIILDSLRAFDIEGEISGRNDLTVNGAKFSGSAFMSDNQARCHHGTLLIDTDMEALARYLTPSKLKISSKGIESVKSRVVNLRKINPDITPLKLINQIIEAFCNAYDTHAFPVYIDRESADEKVLEKEHSYRNWDWNYALTPKFDISYEAKFSWGIFEMDLVIKSGVIKTVFINTDCILNESFEKLKSDLVGVKLEKEVLCKAISGSLKNPDIISDICLFLSDKI